MQYLILVILTILATGCSGEGISAPGSDDAAPSTPMVTPSPTPHPSPSPSPTPSPTPSCATLKSTWHTTTQPNNQLLGVYTGPPTNNVVYTLDWTHLKTGLNTFTYDATHTCSYDITVTGSSVILDDFNGCNPGETPPGGNQSDQCSYCPYAGMHDIVFNYTLGCSQLTVQDTVAGQTIQYN